MAVEVRAHGAALEGAVRRLGFAPADVDEVTQAVWATFLEVLPRFEGRSRVWTFLLGILRREAREARRRGLRAETVDPEALAAMVAASERDAEAVLSGAELHRALRACIEELPAREREVIERRVLAEEPAQAVQGRLGVTSNYLGVLLHRARAHLRHCLHARVT